MLMKEPTPLTSVIIMAYNEAATIESVVREIENVILPAGYAYETLIVDDGSRDGTGEIAERLAAERPHVRVQHHPVNRGLGEVYRTGFAAVRGEYVTFLPADGQFPATIVRDFIPLMQTADLVLGYLPERKSSLFAKALSKAERLVYWSLFGRLPAFQGILMFRRQMLEALNLRPSGRGWGILMEIIVKSKRAGYRIISVPNELRPRRSGESKVNNVRAVVANLRQAIQLRRTI